VFLIVFCYFCIHLKLPLLQDVVDGAMIALQLKKNQTQIRQMLEK